MAKMSVDYEKYEDKIDVHYLIALRNYIEKGIPTGGLLYDVLLNNLMRVYLWMSYVDISASTTWYKLGYIIKFLYDEPPRDCYGSKERIEEWIKKGGREGIERTMY